MIETLRKARQFLNAQEVGGDVLFRLDHASFQDFVRDGIGPADYHPAISVGALPC